MFMHSPDKHVCYCTGASASAQNSQDNLNSKTIESKKKLLGMLISG